MGIAGALAPGLAPGDWVVGEAVLGPAGRVATDAAWAARLLAALPGARPGLVAGRDRMVAEAAAKAARTASRQATHEATAGWGDDWTPDPGKRSKDGLGRAESAVARARSEIRSLARRHGVTTDQADQIEAALVQAVTTIRDALSQPRQ